MNEKLLKELAVKSMVVMLGTAATSYGMGTASVSNASFGENVQIDEDRIISVDTFQSEEVKTYTNIDTGIIVNQLAEPYLTIQKPEPGEYEIALKDKYMDREVEISISNLEDKIFGRGHFFSTSKVSGCVKKMQLIYDYFPEDFTYTAVYTVKLDTVYGYQVYEDEEAFYVELWKPSEMYDRILVVDTGHGGNDIGTYSSDMEYYEKDINLSIVKELKKLLDNEDIKVYYTRTGDKKVYLNPRIDLANEMGADLMVSVHCNASDSFSARGCEVLYGTKNQKNLALNSEAFAAICLNAMTGDGTIPNRGLVKNNDIYIIGKSRVPLALIETGFMTNETDLRYITKKENQKQMAEYIYNAVMQAFSQLEGNVQEK